jgi:hypothetical protein
MTVKKITKTDVNEKAVNGMFHKEEAGYGYYSKLLKEPFDNLAALREAEEAYKAKQKAKEDAAVVRKADAAKVEDAFKAFNAAKRTYREENTRLTKMYADAIKGVHLEYQERTEANKKMLRDAEAAYHTALKEFTNKHESYHMTLRDPETDCETMISYDKKSSDAIKDTIFDLFFDF